MIAFGWITGRARAHRDALRAAATSGPSCIALYSIGTCSSSSAPTPACCFSSAKATTATSAAPAPAFVTVVGPIGAVIASAGATAILGAGGHWQLAALLFGAIPCTLSGLLVLAARNVRPTHNLIPDPSPAIDDFAAEALESAYPRERPAAPRAHHRRWEVT